MKKGKAVQGIPAVVRDEDRLVRAPRTIGAVVQADGTLRPMPSRVVRQSSSVPSISVRGSRGKTITDYEDDEESDDEDYDGSTESSEDWSGAEEDVGNEDVIPVATLVVPPSTKKRSLIVPTPVPRIPGSPFESGASRRPKPTPVMGIASSSTMSGRGILGQQVVPSGESGGHGETEVVPETAEVEMGGDPVGENPVVGEDVVTRPSVPVPPTEPSSSTVVNMSRTLGQGKTYQCFFESLDPYFDALEDPNLSSMRLANLLLELSAIPMREDGDRMAMIALGNSRRELIHWLLSRFRDRFRQMENLNDSPSFDLEGAMERNWPQDYPNPSARSGP